MSYHDDFEDPPRGGISGKLSAILDRQGGGRGPRTPALWIVIVAVGTLGAIIWTSYPKGDGNVTQQNVPIVRADAQAYKTIPDDPGGMNIPHRDSTVFSSLRSDREDSGVENLLAEEESEEPVPRSQLFAGLNTDEVAGSDADVEETASETEPAAGEPEAKPEETAAVDAEKAEPAPAPVTKPEAEETKAAKTEPAAGAALPSGSYYVQLASVKSESAAESEWKNFQTKYSAQLSGYSHRVQRADLDKGTFYRIQAGPVSKDKAVSTCNAIKQVTPGGCLVTE